MEGEREGGRGREGEGEGKSWSQTPTLVNIIKEANFRSLRLFRHILYPSTQEDEDHEFADSLSLKNRKTHIFKIEVSIFESRYKFRTQLNVHLR